MDKFERELEGYTCVYEGLISPATDGWGLVGTDNGSIEIGEGTYAVDGSLAYYYKDQDFSFDSAVNLVSRFEMLSYTPNGVFCGTGFGFHNNHNLFFVGALKINSVEHIGFLKDAARKDLFESWEIGFTIDCEITRKNTIKVISTDLPTSLEPDRRFQIFEGTQAGVYTISEIVEDKIFGTTTLVIEEAFPVDHTIFGNAFFKISFEVLYSDRNTYRMTSLHHEKTCEVYISGHISGVCLTISEPPELTEPVLLGLDTSKEGQVIWGAIDPNAVSNSSWSFFRYSVSPSKHKETSLGHRVFTELGDLPQENPHSEWFLEKDGGYAEIDSSRDALLLKDTVGSDGRIYTRIEPFLTNKVNLDVAIKMRVENFCKPYKIIEIWDTIRAVEVAPIAYTEEQGVGFSEKRRIITLPFVSHNGQITAAKIESSLAILSGTHTFSTEALSTTGLGFTDPTNREVELRFSVESYTLNAGYADFTFTLNFKDTPIEVLFYDGGIAFQGSSQTLFSAAFDWTDKKQHTYRFVKANGALSLSVDGAVLTTVTWANLISTPSANEEKIIWNQTGAEIHFTSMFYQMSPPAGMKKTLGVWLGRNPTDINSWELPRIDASREPNSSLTEVQIQEVNWSDWVDFRIHRDMEWGVTILIDTLGPPPYFNGDYATDITQPSAGWINVEYSQLPVKTSPRSLGYLSFGTTSLSQQRWEWLRYRIFDHPIDDYRSPENMVLNQYNMIHSGEATEDITPEVLSIKSMDSTHISLHPAHIYADRIFKVIVGDQIVPMTSWSFNEEAQLITLELGILSQEHEITTVVCAVKDKITDTYLKAQPLLDSITLLNEGVPSFAKNRIADAERVLQSGSPLSDPYNPLNALGGLVLNDPHTAVTFVEEAQAQYDSMDFYDVKNDGEAGLITSICDSPYPEHGFREIALEGRPFTENGNNLPLIPSFQQLGGMPQTLLFASGGKRALGGLTNSTSTLTYPLAAGNHQRRTLWVFKLNQVNSQGADTDLQEDAPVPLSPYAPTGHSNTPTAPNSADAGCYLSVSQAGNYPRLGPWGGLPSLTPDGNQQIEIGDGVTSNPIGSLFTTGSLLNGGSYSNGIVLQGGSLLPTSTSHEQVLQSAN